MNFAKACAVTLRLFRVWGAFQIEGTHSNCLFLRGVIVVFSTAKMLGDPRIALPLGIAMVLLLFITDPLNPRSPSNGGDRIAIAQEEFLDEAQPLDKHRGERGWRAIEAKVQTSGSPGNSGSGRGCFIATAAYGSDAEGHVLILRRFRDQYLLLNGLGRSLVHLYYRYSPQLATSINERHSLRAVARMGLSPLVGLSMLFSWADLPQRWPLLVTMAVIISVLAYMDLLVRRQRGPTKD